MSTEKTTGLDIMSELVDYMRHQGDHADSLRKQAAYLLNQADEADARAANAQFDAIAIRDARKAREDGKVEKLTVAA